MKTASQFYFELSLAFVTDDSYEKITAVIEQRDQEIREATIKECLKLISRVSELPMQERILSLLQTNKEKEDEK